MEEYVFDDHYSDVVEAEIRFKVKRKLDRDEERLLKDGVFYMVHKIGPALHSSQVKKEREFEQKRLSESEERERSH